MPELSWWQEAMESAIQESNVAEERIGLARMAILERLVSPANDDKSDEDALFGALIHCGRSSGSGCRERRRRSNCWRAKKAAPSFL